MMEMSSPFFSNKLIVGLGNPGEKYTNTRHNIGFIILDTFFVHGTDTWLKQAQFKSLIIKTDSSIFAKPQTFMNNSGEAVSKILNFYKKSPADLVVIHDDVDLELGRIKLAKNSGSAGHHGIESIKEHIGTLDFYRIRVGVGRPAQAQFDIENYVLQNFLREEEEQILKSFETFVKTL